MGLEALHGACSRAQFRLRLGIQLAILQPSHGPYRGILLWTTRSWCATECSAWQCMQMTVSACMDLAQRLLGFRAGQNYPQSIRGRPGGRGSVGACWTGPELEARPAFKLGKASWGARRL